MPAQSQMQHIDQAGCQSYRLLYEAIWFQRTFQIKSNRISGRVSLSIINKSDLKCSKKYQFHPFVLQFVGNMINLKLKPI